MASGSLAFLQMEKGPKMAPYINRKLARCTTCFHSMDRDFYNVTVNSAVTQGKTECVCPHILIERPALISSHNKHFTASSMKDLFDNVAARNIINFVKESPFYSTV